MLPRPGGWLSRCCAYQGSFSKSSKSVVNSVAHIRESACISRLCRDNQGCCYKNFAFLQVPKKSKPGSKTRRGRWDFGNYYPCASTYAVSSWTTASLRRWQHPSTNFLAGGYKGPVKHSIGPSPYHEGGGLLCICFQLFPFKSRLIADKTASFKALQLCVACPATHPAPASKLQ